MEEKIIELITKLNHYTEAYDKGEPLISDTEWDRMYFDLVHLEAASGIYLPTSPTQRVHFEQVSALEKVKHNHPMLSLDKTKDWNEFLRYFDIGKDVVGMVKLDGLTCSLRYLDGKLISAETRGNGEEGEDILHNAIVIKNIPKRIDYIDELVIDGEIICTYHDFAAFKDEYANPRNFAAGSIRLLDSRECSRRNLKFIAWNVVKGLNNKHLDNLVALESFGFTVTPWTSSFDWDAKEFLIEQAKTYGYPIDGLVGRYNDIAYGTSLGATGHHTRAAYAFKFADDEYETELLDIEWSMGRTGQITPIALFEKVIIDGTEVSRASLSNLSIMKQTLGKPFLGQTIYVSKRNEIIPKIEKAKGVDGQWI